MARSSRTASGMPTEYSWRGFGPWYHNAFDLMRRIPSKRDGSASVFDLELSRQVLFTILPDDVRLPWPVDKPPLCITTFTYYDYLQFALICLRTASANLRSEHVYAHVNAADYFRDRLTEQAAKSVVGTFGPWIGTDSVKTSLHHAAQFHIKNAWPGAPTQHKADAFGPAWEHKGKEGWLILRGPSSEVWFDPWVDALRAKGVKFVFGAELQRLEGGDDVVEHAAVRVHGSTMTQVRADHYIMACSPFACRDVFAQSSPSIRNDEQVRKFPGLVQDGQHIQVSFRIGFAEPVLTSSTSYAFILSDSEYNITIMPDDLVFHKDEFLGDGVQSLWTGTACVAYRAGELTGFNVAQSTREGFMREVLHQLHRSRSLDKMIRESNHGRGLASFRIAETEVWHSWVFPQQSDGVATISAPQPKWVTSTTTQRFLPTAATSIRNLVLAGSHTRTNADLWSMEGAAESGRRAAFMLKPNGQNRMQVIPQHKPMVLRALCAVDDVLYLNGLPNVVDLFSSGLLVAVVKYGVQGWIRNAKMPRLRLLLALVWGVLCLRSDSVSAKQFA